MPNLELNPHTCADSFYATGRAQPASMLKLSNLVPAPDSPDQWVARPAAVLLPGSNPFDPGFVSAQVVIGNRLFGMASSALNPGKDQPFCYDLVTQAIVSISGITAANTPTSPAIVGAWTTPHMELIGTKIIVTHAGFSGVAPHFFGVIDTASPSALTWTSANTATNPLVAVPVWVSQFGGRAYYFVNGTQPAVVASDVLEPTTVTNATFVLTFGDNVPLLCGGTLALNNQLGGVIQGLIVFKGASNMFQVTGDFALFTTAVNSLNVATGTLAPNSVTTTPKGLMFVAPDGLRMIDFQGNVSDPVGVAGGGTAVPFIASVVPSRIAAASNSTGIRVSTQNGATIGNDQQEWGFDFTRGAWHGPHTFPVSLISSFNNTFIASPVGIKGLWKTDIIPTTTSVYTENGATYECSYHSANMPERDDLNQLSAVRAVAYLGQGTGVTTFVISALDDGGTPLDTVSLQFTSTQVLWDQFTWGSGALLGSAQNIAAVEIPWGFPIVFDRMALRITTTAAAGIRFGKYLMEYSVLGYTARGPVIPKLLFSIPPPIPDSPPGSLLPPIAANQTVSTPKNVSRVVGLTVGATGGVATSATQVGTPVNGAVINFPSTQVTFTPTVDFVGTGSFRFTLSNSAGVSNTATVTVTVTSTEDPGVVPLLACFGSAPTTARRALINDVFVALRASGVLAKLDVLYVFAAAASDQSLCNWISPTLFHAVQAGTPTFTVDRGWVGIFGTSSINSTWRPSPDGVNYTLNNASAFAWTGDATAASITYINSSARTLSLNVSSTVPVRGGVNNPFNSSGTIVPPATNGLWTITRNISTAFTIYRNTSVLETRTVTTTALDTLSMDTAGTSPKIMSVLGAGAHLTSADVTSLRDTLATYLTAVGAPL